MSDLIAYYVIVFTAILNWLLLLNSKEYNKCNKCQPLNIKIVILLSFLLHYFIHAFGLYGFLFNNKLLLCIYLCIPLVIGIGWKVNKTDYFKSGCTLTNATDIMCDLQDQDTIYFIEIFRTCGIKDVDIIYTKTSPVFILIAIIGYTIAIYKLFYKK